LSPTRRRRAGEDEPLLFDLPLVNDGTVEHAPARRAGAPLQADLWSPPEPDDADDVDAEHESEPEPPRREEPGPRPDTAAPAAGPVIAGVGSRLIAGGADALLHLGVLAGVYLGLLAVGVEPRLGHWPAFAVLLVAFSFLSSVVSLAFWGQTAGMAWRGLQTRDRLQRPLTFRQATLRWTGSLLTFAAAGLPLFLAWGGASLSDWLSRSVTYSLGRASGSVVTTTAR
jgi:hypothetical protein